MTIKTARLHDKQTNCFFNGRGGLAVLIGWTVGHPRLSNLILIYDTGTLLTALFM